MGKYEENSEEEYEKAISYIKETADLGYVKAMSFYGHLILKGRISGIEKAESVKYLQKSAELKNQLMMEMKKQS